MCQSCTVSMPTISLSDGALDARANQMKPQLAVSYPDKINRHQFGGECQVMMAEGGERSDENVIDEDLVVKRNSSECVFPVLTWPPCSHSAHHSVCVTGVSNWARCLRTRMAEKVQTQCSLPAEPTAACTAKQRKKRQTELQKAPKVGQLKRWNERVSCCFPHMSNKTPSTSVVVKDAATLSLRKVTLMFCGL